MFVVFVIVMCVFLRVLCLFLVDFNLSLFLVSLILVVLSIFFVCCNFRSGFNIFFLVVFNLDMVFFLVM